MSVVPLKRHSPPDVMAALAEHIAEARVAISQLEAERANLRSRHATEVTALSERHRKERTRFDDDIRRLCMFLKAMGEEPPTLAKHQPAKKRQPRRYKGHRAASRLLTSVAQAVLELHDAGATQFSVHDVVVVRESKEGIAAKHKTSTYAAMNHLRDELRILGKGERVGRSTLWEILDHERLTKLVEADNG